jgi:DNA invertase Pin-like site-specific DNA recombinase
MFADQFNKVTTEHLRRDAFLYIRQSSLRQVLENTESTQRQYALRDRAVSLGWPIERIHIIDSDLGMSGASAQDRDGFQRLVAEVANGHAGIVLGLEVSRLARNNADWHRLLELAALTGTLILDEDGVYDPAHFNDRLLLGLKGAMSEAELHMLRARLQGGICNKAKRGELQTALPIGLAYHTDGSVILDPDQSIRAALQLLFDTFRQTGSASATVRRFQREGWLFPRRVRRGVGKGDVLWGIVDHSRVIQILHNPRYAGAFVYGRTRTVHPGRRGGMQLRVARAQWQVLIRNAHAGYIDWAEYERNELTLKQNLTALTQWSRGSMPREGPALLQGRVICGICGERMRVRYQEVGGKLEPYYMCTESAVRRAGKACQSIRGGEIDRAIGTLLLESVAPAAIEVALAIEDEIAGRIDQAAQQRARQLARVRYEAELARRRYLNVDPANRLVADTLEADWNERLRQLETLQQQHEQQQRSDQKLLGDDARARIRQLAEDFPRIWHDEKVTALERKRMVGLLIEDVTLIKATQITMQVRFRGGRTTSLTIDKPKAMALVRKTRPEVVRLVDELLNTCSDREAAQWLNEQGNRNWRGDVFTQKKVAVIRRAYHLKSRYDRLRAQGMLTAPELAQQLGVCTTTIYQLGQKGLLHEHQYGNRDRCLYEPIDSTKFTKSKSSRKPHSANLSTAESTTQGAI